MRNGIESLGERSTWSAPAYDPLSTDSIHRSVAANRAISQLQCRLNPTCSGGSMSFYSINRVVLQSIFQMCSPILQEWRLVDSWLDQFYFLSVCRRLSLPLFSRSWAQYYYCVWNCWRWWSCLRPELMRVVWEQNLRTCHVLNPDAVLDLIEEIAFWTRLNVSSSKWKLLAIVQPGGTTGWVHRVPWNTEAKY